MNIIEELQKRANLERADDPEAINTKLIALIQLIKKDVEHHLSLIASQMENFDIHDFSHSDKILSNIQRLLGEKTSSLTNYELFLVYLSCYLHDCGMALPQWEINLLKLTEGAELLDVPDFRKNLRQDMKRPCAHTEALSEIRRRKQSLYESFDSISSFIFLTKPESDFETDLCSRLIEYQEFRNGYSGELRKFVNEKDVDGYYEFSEFLRGEFIRSTHARRIEKYVQNLASRFEESLGGAWGKSLAHDLAKICRSHGEDFDYVQDLGLQQSYLGKETANLRFVSIMLRLGDVLHFSFDRASKSLLAEKMIDSEVSLKHWKAKFQGLNYSLEEIDTYGKIKIKYMAFCDNPESYYFIQDYIGYVEEELGNYFKFKAALDYVESTKGLVKRYELQLPDKVDASQVRYDKDKFIPVPNMGFTLNQNRILELLMGVGLYKDKYYSLRELYQNSLDACRCMIATYANEKIEFRGNIEFGLGKEIIDGRERIFVYCLDNGIGMDKQIVQGYFLRIGNSYYTSREYRRRASKLKNSFQPTSQFGIGILSCFMIADRLEITSIPLDENRKPGDAIRFAVDGPHERFYYMNPNSFDTEKIGIHGTLIKLFLKPEEESVINTSTFDNLLIVNYGAHNNEYVANHKEIYARWNGNLFNLLNKVVGAVGDGITLSVTFDNGEKVEILPHSTPMDIYEAKSDMDLIRELNRNRVYFNDGKNPTDEFLKCRDFIDVRQLKVEYEGVEYQSLICLPKPAIPVTDPRVLSFMTMLRDNAVLVDGIVADNPSNMAFLGRLGGIVNFCGEELPKLSVDRTTIISLSDKLRRTLNELPSKVATAAIEIIEEHSRVYSIDKDSVVAQLLWDYIFSRYFSITTQLLQVLLEAGRIEMPANDIEKFMGTGITVRKLADLQNITLDRFDFRIIGNISREILLSKLVGATKIKIHDLTVDLATQKLHSLISIDGITERFTEMVVYADEWDGKYSEYDIVTQLWPIVPRHLFDQVQNGTGMGKIISVRGKQIHRTSNTLSGIFDLESVSIHSRLGLFKFEGSFGFKKPNRVGKYGKAQDNYWFPEINWPHDKRRSKCYVVYAFISPSNLTVEEKKSLEEFKKVDPEYYEGVIQGWSVLFLEGQGKYVIKAGIAKRDEMLALVKEEFFEENREIHFAFLDDTPLR